MWGPWRVLFEKEKMLENRESDSVVDQTLINSEPTRIVTGARGAQLAESGGDLFLGCRFRGRCVPVLGLRGGHHVGDGCEKHDRMVRPGGRGPLAYVSSGRPLGPFK